MAHDLVTVLDQRPQKFRTLFQGPNDREGADFDVEAPKDPKQTPHAHPGSIFKRAFRHQSAHAGIRGITGVGQHIFGGRVALQQAVLAAGLDIQVEIDGDPRASRPFRVGWIRAVSMEVSRGR
jgi:hypothetical protein